MRSWASLALCVVATCSGVDCENDHLSALQTGRPHGKHGHDDLAHQQAVSFGRSGEAVMKAVLADASCPAEQVIRTEEGCRIAATVLDGKKYRFGFALKRRDRPTGCYYFEKHNKVYWNKGNGRTRKFRNPVCKAPAPLESKCARPRCGFWNTDDPQVECPNTIYSCAQNGLIALTFDDDIDIEGNALIGEDGVYGRTMKTSEELYNAGIPATFFVSGAWHESEAKRKESLQYVKTMYKHHHQVATHTQSHKCSVGQWTCPIDEVFAEGELVANLEAWQQEVETETGMTVQGYKATEGSDPRGWFWYRPPFMDMNAKTAEEVGRLGYKVAWLTDDTMDWQGNVTVVEECLDSVVALDSKNSSHIVLQHGRESGKLSQEYWHQLKAEADRNGWRFVTLDECARR